MPAAELSIVFKVLGAVAKPATDKLKRKEGVVVADAYGGLSAYDLATGIEVATANLSTKVRGAIFREATGLPPHVLDHLARNGAIVD